MQRYMPGCAGRRALISSGASIAETTDPCGQIEAKDGLCRILSLDGGGANRFYTLGVQMEIEGMIGGTAARTLRPGLRDEYKRNHRRVDCARPPSR